MVKKNVWLIRGHALGPFSYGSKGKSIATLPFFYGYIKHIKKRLKMILEYNEFILEKQLIRSRRDLAISVFERLEEVQPILIEAVEMVELGIFDGFSLDSFANFTDEQLNENLFKVAKEKLQKY